MAAGTVRVGVVGVDGVRACARVVGMVAFMRLWRLSVEIVGGEITNWLMS